jgi:threonine dehydratase
MSEAIEHKPGLEFVRVTPLVFAPPLKVWLKLESLQVTSSFKVRGAALKLSRLSPELRGRGVVTASAGNHGQGLALAAARLGVAATVVVPRLCPAIKRDAIAGYGAEVVVDGDGYDAAEARALALAAQRGVPYVSPFDDDDIIAGNGEWLGRELLEQHHGITHVIAPVGGGGLVSGLLQVLSARAEVIGVQPRVNCAMHDSLAQGRALVRYHGGDTLCEGLEGATAERTFAIARAHRLAIMLVDEQEILEAVGFAYRRLGLVVEPSAAVGIAAVRAGRVPVDDGTVVVISGGNIEPALLDRAIAAFDGSRT